MATEKPTVIDGLGNRKMFLMDSGKAQLQFSEHHDYVKWARPVDPTKKIQDLNIGEALLCRLEDDLRLFTLRRIEDDCF